MNASEKNKKRNKNYKIRPKENEEGEEKKERLHVKLEIGLTLVPREVLKQELHCLVPLCSERAIFCAPVPFTNRLSLQAV